MRISKTGISSLKRLVIASAMEQFVSAEVFNLLSSVCSGVDVARTEFFIVAWAILGMIEIAKLITSWRTQG
jgi:hypothetical protein